ncbi:hypothetical protein GGR58DRAFT_92859 [Xylaria digitata]|nr:hypothetical protein GGR58DRAFT_92859 [Xylaria digitata]
MYYLTPQPVFGCCSFAKTLITALLLFHPLPPSTKFVITPSQPRYILTVGSPISLILTISNWLISAKRARQAGAFFLIAKPCYRCGESSFLLPNAASQPASSTVG